MVLLLETLDVSIGVSSLLSSCVSIVGESDIEIEEINSFSQKYRVSQKSLCKRSGLLLGL